MIEVALPLAANNIDELVGVLLHLDAVELLATADGGVCGREHVVHVKVKVLLEVAVDVRAEQRVG